MNDVKICPRIPTVVAVPQSVESDTGQQASSAVPTATHVSSMGQHPPAQHAPTQHPPPVGQVKAPVSRALSQVPRENGGSVPVRARTWVDAMKEARSADQRAVVTILMFGQQPRVGFGVESKYQRLLKYDEDVLNLTVAGEQHLG